MTRKWVRFNDEIARVGMEQHLLARACATGNEELLVEALSMDALVPEPRHCRAARARDDGFPEGSDTTAASVSVWAAMRPPHERGEGI